MTLKVATLADLKRKRRTATAIAKTKKKAKKAVTPPERFMVFCRFHEGEDLTTGKMRVWTREMHEYGQFRVMQAHEFRQMVRALHYLSIPIRLLETEKDDTAYESMEAVIGTSVTPADLVTR